MVFGGDEEVKPSKRHEALTIGQHVGKSHRCDNLIESILADPLIMRSDLKYDQSVGMLARATLLVFFLYGLLITCFPLLPFWIDEWLLLDNLKFKSQARLWGALEHTQQFPRVYLQAAILSCA